LLFLSITFSAISAVASENLSVAYVTYILVGDTLENPLLNQQDEFTAKYYEDYVFPQTQYGNHRLQYTFHDTTNTLPYPLRSVLDAQVSQPLLYLGPRAAKECDLLVAATSVLQTPLLTFECNEAAYYSDSSRSHYPYVFSLNRVLHA